ncbi:hypothetical protein B0T24DRAFT_361853 [Lasiosphaeria ovina]|uniref:Uncharacterized protein n=1 Tax=Lasiosphaeria ovina TaxID=92902 RepID=A0AAE0K575_9PEZI|nr:hypothetical protein B0T24DRAFT_361853 [Lasiosphaeria ovina]
MANPDLQNTSEIITAIASCLTEEPATNKAPARLDKTFEDFSKLDHISHAFLNGGFLAWYAYYVATQRSEVIKDSASRLSPSLLQHVVTEVSKITPNNSVRKRVDCILYNSHRGSKRSELLASNGIGMPSPLSPSSEPNSRPPKRTHHDYAQHDSTSPVLDAHDMAQVDDPSNTIPYGGAGQQNTVAARIADSVCWDEALELTTFEHDPRYEYVWPNAANLPFVFPHYMCTAIVKRAGKASIMASFPSDPASCRLVFDISATEVQHVAKELFGIHIQVVNGRRRLLYENGPTVKINRSVTLAGTAGASIDNLYGQMVGDAFRHSPRRMEEISMGELLSKCLEMVVWGTSDRPSRLYFMVEAERLAPIFTQLWQHPLTVMPS